MLLYSTLLCKKIARAPGGHKKFMLTKLGGGREQNRSEKTWIMKNISLFFFIYGLFFLKMEKQYKKTAKLIQQ